jgi:4-hydroxyphenylpyruvate dioxygenase
MQPCLAQVCTLNAPFEIDISDYAAGQCRAVELWFGKLETYLEKRSVDDVRRLLDEHEMAAPVASFQGGLLDTQGEKRRESWDHFARRLKLCQSIGVKTVVVAADLYQPLSQQDFERVKISLKQAAEQAGTSSVRIALEFQAAATFCNNLQTAAWLVGEIGNPNLGLCLDLFHYYAGPSKPEDLAHLTAEQLFHVQLCDLAGIARELAVDGDRVLPGDGDFQNEPIIDRLSAIDYRGYVSVELMNPQIWAIPPRSFGEIAMTALRKVLGQASMGS